MLNAPRRDPFVRSRASRTTGLKPAVVNRTPLAIVGPLRKVPSWPDTNHSARPLRASIATIAGGRGIWGPSPTAATTLGLTAYCSFPNPDQARAPVIGSTAKNAPAGPCPWTAGRWEETDPRGG